MATISSISGELSATVSGSRQFRLQQARRDAEQAEGAARALQAKASGARQQANEAVENARAIAAQSAQAQSIAGQARLAVAAVEASGRTRTEVASVGVVDHVAAALNNVVSATLTLRSGPPVVNTQGQLTGTFINITA